MRDRPLNKIPIEGGDSLTVVNKRHRKHRSGLLTGYHRIFGFTYFPRLSGGGKTFDLENRIGKLTGTMAGTPLLCRIGIHRWGRKRGYNEYASNVVEWEQVCERCGRRKRWIETKKGRR